MSSLNVPGQQVIKLGGGHCCVCSQFCHHIGGPVLCAEHKPRYATGGVVQPFPPAPARRFQRAGVGDTPCGEQVQAVLGFVEPTWIPCGLAEGHDGRHRFEIEWGVSSQDGGDHA